MTANLLACCYLVAVGLLPAFALSRSWAVALPLSGLVTGLVSTVAVMGSLVLRAPLPPCLAVAVALAWVASAVSLRRPAHCTLVVRPAALAVIAGLSVAVLLATVAAPVEWDARMIWFFHASWFSEGGDAARVAMANPALRTSHADYPPLVPASVAGLWSLAGDGSLRLAQAVTAVQGWLAVVLAGVLATSIVRRPLQLVAAAFAGAFALACFGVAGGFGVRGYADLVWAAAAVSGALALLVLPVDRRTQLIGACCLAAAMLTKAEGFVSGVAVFVPLALWRVVRHDRRLTARRLAPLLVVVATTALWPLLATAFVADPQRDVDPGSLAALLRGEPDKLQRVEPALTGLWGYSRITIATAGLVVAVGWLAHARSRRRRGLGSPLWLPTAAVGCFAVSFAVLAAGDLDVNWWVASGGFRTMTVVRALLLAEVLVLAVTLLDEAAERRARPTPVDGSPSAAAAPPVPSDATAPATA